MKAGVVKEAMACCKLYISEARSQTALDAIAAAAAVHGRQAPLLNTFPDLHYNRVGYTLVSAFSQQTQQQVQQEEAPLQAAVMDMVTAALSHINLQQHAGSHPRLGVVDHICFHPLGSSSLPSVASLARSLSLRISSHCAVPTYVYGAAHPENRPLDYIRRSLGYFSPNVEGGWLGSTSLQQLNLVPDFGPRVANLKSGVVVVGACSWIANYNIPILSNDLKLGRKVAKSVSSRGGGLPAVQAMALLHGSDRMEIACNLTNSKLTSADMVQEEVSRLAELEGLCVLSGYFTDLSEEEITGRAHRKLFGSEAV